ncbi:MAG: class I tRNA ligase family protein [Candidatus Dormibacteria bacterium]
METLALLLAPYCPHVAEEIWERLGGPYSVHQQGWPQADPKLLGPEDTVVVVIAVNGRKRHQLEVKSGTSAEELETLALESARVQQFLQGRSPTRVVVVPDRQVNLVSCYRGMFHIPARRAPIVSSDLNEQVI